MAGESAPLSSILRAFDIIDLLLELNGAGPSEIAERMDVPKSTAYIYLHTLQKTGYVINEDGRYHPSYRFLTTGSRIKHDNRLFHVSEDILKGLAEKTGEMVTLVVEQAGKAVILHKEFGDQSLELGIYSGMATPLHSVATGKAVLAYLPEERVDEIIDRHGLTQVTDQTITDEDVLREKLREIREQEYAVDWDQQVKGMGIIAAPIHPGDQLLGAVGIACPTGRIKDAEYRRTLLQKLQETVDSINIKYLYGM